MKREIVFDADFWNCRCDEDRIHTRFRECCIRCGAQPNSAAGVVSYLMSLGWNPPVLYTDNGSQFRNPKSKEAV